MKKFLILLFVLFGGLCPALDIFVEANRFLDQEGNTILEINYQVPYKELEFTMTENGFEAILEVEFFLFRGEKQVYDYGFPNGIIVSDKQQTVAGGVFSDKISITLAKHSFDVVVNFIDKKSGETSNWEYEFYVLSPESLISDLEFSRQILPDSSSYLQKFHRDGKLYDVLPSHIFSKSDTDFAFIFFEIYNPQNEETEFTITRILSRQDTLVDREEEKISFSKRSKSIEKKIPLLDLAEGFYVVGIEVVTDDQFDFRQDFLTVKSSRMFSRRIFPDLEDEYKLITYFLSSEQTKIWPALSKEGKRTFINRFWSANNPDPGLEENEFFELIKERINYANIAFSHFENGWDTDRGRIYIRHGKPDEIIKGNTGLNTKYTQKEYQIWKYRTRADLTYIFIDLQLSGNYKIIYADNDEYEYSLPNWQSYLGTDFDESVLQ